MFDALATALSWFYELTHSFGGAIMLLTLAIMVLLTPLTLKGTRSMIAMQRLQPEMKKLQNRYKDDRQKLNEEMMKFYKEHSINPVGGCLPLLLQMPVFFVLYRVLIGLTDHAPYGSDMGRAVALAARDPQAAYGGFGHFEPAYLDRSSQLFRDLSNVSQMKSFGLDLADTASNVISQGVVSALPYLALIAIIGVTAWYQQKQIQGRNPQLAQQVNPQQQMIMKIMPFFLPIISFTLPAGVVLYFLVSNLYRIGQQAFITRTMYGDGQGGAAIDTTAREAAEPRPGFFGQLKEIATAGQSRPGNVSEEGRGKGRTGAAQGRSPERGAKAGGEKAGRAKGGGSKYSGAKGSGAKGAGANARGSKAARAKATGAETGEAKAGGAAGAATAGGATARGAHAAGSHKRGAGAAKADSAAPGNGAQRGRPQRPRPPATGATIPPAGNGKGGDALASAPDGAGGPTRTNGADETKRPSRAAPSRRPPPADPNRSRTKKRRK